jgi:hypothetical protein
MLFIMNRESENFRSDERPKGKNEEFTLLRHWVGRGAGTPKDKDGVKRREVCECEG